MTQTICQIHSVEQHRTGYGHHEPHGLGRSPKRVGVVAPSDEGSAVASGTYTSGAYATDYRVCAVCAAYLERDFAADINAGFLSIRRIYSMRRYERASAAGRDTQGRFAPPSARA